MDSWIIILLVGIVLAVVLYQFYTYKINKAREQQRAHMTQNISHELKTPVTSIRGILETVLTNPEMSDEQRVSFLQRAYDQSARLSSLVEDISLINKLDAQSELYPRTEVDLQQVVQSVIDDLSLYTKQQGATVSHNVPTRMMMDGNYGLLYSIFHNIVENALHYIDHPDIRIQCLSFEPHIIRLSVYDNGPGVPAESLDHLFERFYRVDKGRSRKAGGTGLGLSIVKHAVLYHGGTITATNRPNGGLEFQFTLRRYKKR